MMNASNFGTASVYFCFIIIFGSYFLLNLVLAVIIDAYNKIDLKERKKEEAKNQEEVEMFAKRIAAIRTIYRMIRLTEKRMELFEVAGLEYKMSFFDLVFLSMKKLKYDKVEFNRKNSSSNLGSSSKRRNGMLDVMGTSIRSKVNERGEFEH